VFKASSYKAAVSIFCAYQHTSAYVSIRQHTSVYVSIRQHTSVSIFAQVLKLACLYHYATSVCGLKLLAYEAFSYECMRPGATGVCGLELLVYAALSY